MGIIDDAKNVAETAGRKVKEAWDDTTDKISDKVDEVKADAELKKTEAKADAEVAAAQANKESVQQRNDLKEKLRDEN